MLLHLGLVFFTGPKSRQKFSGKKVFIQKMYKALQGRGDKFLVRFSPTSSSRPTGRRGGLDRARHKDRKTFSKPSNRSQGKLPNAGSLKWMLDGERSAAASACSCGQSPAPPRPLQEETSSPERWNPTDWFVSTHMFLVTFSTLANCLVVSRFTNKVEIKSCAKI